MKRLRARGLALALIAAALPGPAATAPEDGPIPLLPRLLRSEPPRDSARHLGDLLVYRALIDWPPDWEIDREALRANLRQDGPFELRGYQIEAARSDCADCRWLSLTWQLFRTVPMTADLPLPATPLRLRKGAQSAELLLPASRIAVSPLVPWERRAAWIDSLRPGWQAPRLDARSRWMEGGVWLGLTLLALAAWAWSSGRWLPRRSARPFAQAWRTVRSRPRSAAGALALADADDLRCWHRAFDQTAGETVFAGRLDAFFTAQPALAPLADEARAVFAASQRAFYLDPGADPATGATDTTPTARLSRKDLIALLRRLVEHEFRLASDAHRSAPKHRSAHASV